MDGRKMQYGRRYEEPTGQAVLTEGYNLPAEHVIHTVGPIVGGRLTRKHRAELRSCYENVMRCCVAHKIRSVAFCCISTGEFHFPNDEAAKIAVETVTEFLEDHEAQFIVQDIVYIPSYRTVRIRILISFLFPILRAFHPLSIVMSNITFAQLR